MLVLMPHTDSHMVFAKDEEIQADRFHENKNAGPPPFIFWMLNIENTASKEEKKIPADWEKKHSCQHNFSHEQGMDVTAVFVFL